MISQRSTRVYPAAVYPVAIHPAAQTKPVSFAGASATGGFSVKINCLDWVWLSRAQKLKYGSAISQSNPSGPVRAIDNFCNMRLGGKTKPAGQTDVISYPGQADMTFTGNGAEGYDSSGNVYDASGGVVGGTTPTTTPAVTPSTTPEPVVPTETPSVGTTTLPPSVQPPTDIIPKSETTGGVATDFSAGGQTAAKTPTAPSAPLLTPQQQTALLGAVGSILNTTGTAIAAAIQSGNQLELSRLQTQAQLEIARLQTQSQQSMSAGNLTLAQQQSQAAAQLQMFQNLLASQSQTNTVWYVLAGVAALVVIGAAIYFAPTIRQSAQPATMRSTRSQTRSKR